MKESRAKLADKYIRQLKEKQRNLLCKKGGAHIVSTAFLFGVLFCSVPHIATPLVEITAHSINAFAQRRSKPCATVTFQARQVSDLPGLKGLYVLKSGSYIVSAQPTCLALLATTTRVWAISDCVPSLVPYTWI